MKKMIALLLSLLLALGCAALAEELSAETDQSLGFSDGMEMTYVSSFEEAAQYYTGEIPLFTAPEGFRLKDILVSNFGLTAYYTTAAEESTAEESAADEDAAAVENEEAALAEPEAISGFEFSIYEYGKADGISYYSLMDGELSETVASMVALYEAGGIVYSADVHTPGGAIYFYFEGLDQAQVEAVLAGLQV